MAAGRKKSIKYCVECGLKITGGKDYCSPCHIKILEKIKRIRVKKYQNIYGIRKTH
jgi:predicted nucleic acid-binding Zn ribbon protein